MTAMFVRARAFAMLKATLGAETRATYLGITGGTHIFHDGKGRVWSVDLVLGTVAQCVGLPPSQWRHPPRLE